MMSKLETQTLGYPRIGRDREMKKATEAYWKGNLDDQGLWEAFRLVEDQVLEAQVNAGIEWVGVGDITPYDHVLDWAIRFGLIPSRFQGLQGLEATFAMARGLADEPPLELTKWFDTNYHYLVPEFESDLALKPDFDPYLSSLSQAQDRLGQRAIPILLGPITFLALSRLDIHWNEALEKLIPLYRELLEELRNRSFVEVQLHEPGLVLGEAEAWKTSCERAYEVLAQADLPLNLVTTFDDLGEAFAWISRLPLAALSLDFTRGHNLDLIRTYGWPDGLTLGAGIVDGRNVWRIRPSQFAPLLNELSELADLRVGASCSLMFVPHSAAREDHLPEQLRAVLAFADEKLNEIRLLGSAPSSTEDAYELAAIEAAWDAFGAASPTEPDLQARLNDLSADSFVREAPFEQRRGDQITLPPFPTTTIGSFPQTSAVRSLRAKFKRGDMAQEAYFAGIDAWIAYTIGAQEALGLDVLVHGEFERSDMVEYFAEKMRGFAFTRFGWVQSYGNRYVRPPIIWADVHRIAPITIREFQAAQSFTKKPVKGMLTGPVTILNWSFPRIDIPHKEIAFQIALALRDEIADLEAAGARVIQVDEPALREGLPLKPAHWDAYLKWAVDAFRLTTAGARRETQIHTHMCYAEFGDILDAIDGLNADVISIENTRSGDANLLHLAMASYPREVGPGVYDVHSDHVPDREQVKARLRRFAEHLRPTQIWVNPDCGLKTRAWEEVLPSLANITQAVKELRAELEKEGEGLAAAK